MVISTEVPDTVPEEKIVGVDLALSGCPGMKGLVFEIDPLVIDNCPVGQGQERFRRCYGISIEDNVP